VFSCIFIDMRLSEEILRIQEVMGISSETQSIIKEGENFFKSFLDRLLNKVKPKNPEKEFQKIVNLIFKMTIKDTTLDGVGGFKVAAVYIRKWGDNFNNPNDPGRTWKIQIRLYPLFRTKDVSESKFTEQYKEFQKQFETNAELMGLVTTSPITNEKVVNYEVSFDFMDISFKDIPMIQDLG